MAINVKGLIKEFVLIIILNVFDLATEFTCFSELQVARSRYQGWIASDNYVANRTLQKFPVCQEGGYWEKEIYAGKVQIFANIVDVYLFFLLASSAVLACYVCAYLWFIIRAWHGSSYIEENRQHIIRVKFMFGFILSFVLDIPGSCMAVVMYAMRYGKTGLHCWDCAQDVKNCYKKQELEHRVYLSQVAVTVMLFGLIVVSLWKGITTFYRWSKTDKVDCWQLRGCVALFVGTYYVVIILTPALAVFKYKFFMLPSQKDNVFANFTDSLFMIGLLGWIIFMVIGCCFPLLKCIRVGSPNSTNKSYQNV